MSIIFKKLLNYLFHVILLPILDTKRTSMRTLTEKQKSLYRKPFFGFYIQEGKGEGGVTIFLLKSRALWLFRMVFFLEFSRFVLDQEGMPVIFNKIALMEKFIEGKIRYNATVNWHTFENMPKAEYEAYWAKKGLTPEQIKDEKINDVWPYPYHLQFYLEKPKGFRSIIPFYIS